MSINENLEHFKYTPIEDGEIRVLHVLPGERDSVIQCQIFRGKLVENVKYDALSYAWGQAPASQVIEVNQKKLLVSPNLYAAIIELRADFSSTLSRDIRLASNPATVSGERTGFLSLWIDAICINQEDNLERRQQVLQMGKIFRSAAKLHIWLGTAQDNSDLAINFISFISRHPDKNWTELRDLIGIKSSNTAMKIFRAVADFFARAWFSRSWIIQEYVLAATEDTKFLCGTSRISVSEMNLAKFPRIATSGEALIDQAFFDYFTPALLRWLQLSWESKEFHNVFIPLKEENSLLRWLVSGRATKATDERDKVYSVLGLCNPKNYDPEALLVNYDESVQNVYSSVVKSIISATKRLYILGACAERGDLIQRTWTPDWTMPRQMHVSLLVNVIGGIDRENGFSASKDLEAIVHFAHDLSTMTVRGLLLDVVYSSTPGSDIPCKLTAVDFPSQKLAIQILWVSFYRLRRPKSERAAKASFWRTLLFSCFEKIPYLYSLGLEEGLQNRFIIEEAHELPLLTSSPEMTRLAHDRTLYGEVSCWYTPQLISHLENGQHSRGVLLLTRRGYIGKSYSHSKVKKGDLVCILLGSDVPIILRPVGDRHELVGDAYIDGIMHGEAIEALEKGKFALQDFVLH